MNIYKIIKNTSVEGPGRRFCIWVQGCSKHCPGCFAKETWDFNSGKKYSIDNLYQMIKLEKNIEGVTFLGGEPFEQAKELSKLSKLIKQENLTIVCFTGFLYEELKNKNDKYVNKFLESIDLLIDGGFEEEKFDLSRPWVGSSNQRFIFLTDKYNPQEILNYKNKVEMRIDTDGRIVINGMGDFNNLKENLCLQLDKNIIE